MPRPLIVGNHIVSPQDWPVVMGILNVTPDSFSDGGDFVDADAAVARAVQMRAEGATIVDVGPESTRPGSQPVSAEEQIRRAVPVVRAIRAALSEVMVSIDTRLAIVAEQAIEAGADMVNDVSALRDDAGMADVVARTGVSLVLMHRRGTSSDMQKDGGPAYVDVVSEIADFLRERIAFAVSRGISADRIVVDPGIGFGKRVEHNLQIMSRLDELVGLGHPLLIGASRKSFLGAVLRAEDPRRRMAGSLAAALIAAQAGVAIVRAHDVRETAEALRVWRHIRASGRDGAS